MGLTDARWEELLAVRAFEPERVAEAYRARRRRPLLGPDRRLLIVAADHPARGALAASGDPDAMADRRTLLDRLLTALEHPQVDGVLATPELVEDLLLLGALEGKVVLGSTNRGGLKGAVWELDDPVTAYDAESIAGFGLDGGKLLLRIDERDPATVRTLTVAAAMVTALAGLRLPAVIEPLPYTRDAAGTAVLDPDPDRLVRAVTVAAGLGVTSAYTWLKLPATGEVARAVAATTLPVVLLGGDPGAAAGATFAAWEQALGMGNVRGLMAGRSLLYPADGDVAGAVAAAAALVHGVRAS
jgi:hypothetical protein